MGSMGIGGMEFLRRAGLIAAVEIVIGNHRVGCAMDKEHRDFTAAEGGAARIVERKALEETAV